MKTLESIDQSLRETEVEARKNYLIRQLRFLGLELSIDGRMLEDLSLYTLEWMHVEEKNKAAKAFGDVHNE
ncbi:hypothetical protein [Paucisalibacillus globulus]|uniref:hypothetical protein n=1 Tax=Paucisalibacillus globulus TaxID=351095 RepID=UPI0004076E90|nr:hypothetical protein [Paucisalibacillus globulus]